MLINVQLVKVFIWIVWKRLGITVKLIIGDFWEERNRMTLFVTSDNHWGNTAIIKYCSRPFKSVTEMNDVMVARWNNVVNEDDTVFHLGDFALTSKHHLKKLRDSLNGDIILIPGNHDHPTRLRDYGIFVLDSLFSEGVSINIGNLIFTHRPLLNIPNLMVNVHGHIHNKSSYGRYLNMSVDVTNFTPVSFEEVVKRAKKILKG